MLDVKLFGEREVAETLAVCLPWVVPEEVAVASHDVPVRNAQALRGAAVLLSSRFMGDIGNAPEAQEVLRHYQSIAARPHGFGSVLGIMNSISPDEAERVKEERVLQVFARSILGQQADVLDDLVDKLERGFNAQGNVAAAVDVRAAQERWNLRDDEFRIELVSYTGGDPRISGAGEKGNAQSALTSSGGVSPSFRGGVSPGGAFNAQAGVLQICDLAPDAWVEPVRVVMCHGFRLAAMRFSEVLGTVFPSWHGRETPEQVTRRCARYSLLVYTPLSQALDVRCLSLGTGRGCCYDREGMPAPKIR